MILVALIGSGALTLTLLSARGSATAPAATANKTSPAPEAPTPSTAATAAAAPGWTENAKLWAANDRKGIAFELPARDETQVWMKKVRPLLVVRCAARRIDVFVFTDSAAAMEAQDEDHTVQVALDGEAARTERWPDSVSHDALFVPDGASFVRQLSRAKTMQFGYTPHNAAPVVAHFDVSGLADRIARASAQCGGK
jgi:hypothetical protein